MWEPISINYGRPLWKAQPTNPKLGGKTIPPFFDGLRYLRSLRYAISRGTRRNFQQKHQTLNKESSKRSTSAPATNSAATCSRWLPARLVPIAVRARFPPDATRVP